MQNWKPEQLYFFFSMLNGELSKKNSQFFNLSKLKMFELSPQTGFMNDKMRRVFELKNSMYVNLCSFLNSGVLDFDTLIVCLLGEYIRTKKKVKIEMFDNLEDIKKLLNFYNIIGSKNQSEYLLSLINKKTTTMNKFINGGDDIFKNKEDQKNELYNLILKGKVSYLFYSYFLNNGKIKIDESKIIDEEFKKFIKIIKFVKDIDMCEIKNI